MMVLNKYSSLFEINHFRDCDGGVLSLRIKETFAKVCILCSKNTNPETESLKGLYNIIDVGGSIYTQSA